MRKILRLISILSLICVCLFGIAGCNGAENAAEKRETTAEEPAEDFKGDCPEFRDGEEPDGEFQPPCPPKPPRKPHRRGGKGRVEPPPHVQPLPAPEN